MIKNLKIFLALITSVSITTRAESESKQDIYFDLQRSSGIWAFDLLYADKPNFVSKPLDEVAKKISADKPFVKGLAPRFSWKSIEPEEGKYNWAPIDRLFKIAEKYDKLVCLRLIAGQSRGYSPDWIWQYVSNYVDTISSWKKESRIPYLGDPGFQKHWNEFLVNVGSRYSKNPRLQRVGMSSGIGQEMYYIGNFNDEQIKKLCFKGTNQMPADLLKSWHQTFLTYKTAFPDQVFLLDLSIPVKGVKGVEGAQLMEAIVKDASSVLGNHLCLQQDGLSERTRPADKVGKNGDDLHKTMLNMADKHVLGFQTLMPPETMATIPNAPVRVHFQDLRGAFNIALTYPIHYLEVFTVNLNDPKRSEDIKYLDQELKKRIQ